MSRIEKCFSSLAAHGRKALIPYITAGDPVPDVTVDYMHALVEAGADIIELGVPFSDPMADGPVIQKACERALKHGVCLTDLFAMVAEFRQRDTQTPVVLMGYLNPIERLGFETFALRARDVGIDGVLVVDMPPEESDELGPLLDQYELEPIYLVAPTTSPERAATICAHASGYLYYVSLKGVTGSASVNADDVAEHLAPLRQLTSLPLCVGFGIRDGASAAEVARVADGVIVGSALVSRIAENEQTPRQAIAELKALLREMRQALDA